jgi:hypothetical protein
MRTLKQANKAAIEATNEQINNLTVMVNDFLPKFAAATGQTITTIEGLAAAIQNPSSYHRNLVIQQIPKIEYGVPVDVEQKARLLQFPNLSTLAEITDTIKSHARGLDYSTLFEMDGINRVKVNKAAREIALDVHRVYATSTEENTLIDLQDAFVSAFVAFKDYTAKVAGVATSKQYFDVAGHESRFEIQNFMDIHHGINPELTRSIMVQVGYKQAK